MMPAAPALRVFALLACVLCTNVFGQDRGRADDVLSAANRLAQQGRHTEAEAAYSKVLTAQPGNGDALVGRGFVRAWQKKYDTGIADFQNALRLDPSRVDARNGLGYTLAWAGRFDAAEREFSAVLKQAPDDFDAAKGMGYVALWRPDPPVAVKRFTALSQRHPNNAEVFVGLGQAHLANGDRTSARTAFEQASALDPTRSDAQQGLKAAQEAPPAAQASYELTVFYGRTRFGDGTSKSGARSAQFAAQVSPALRLWASYDGGLGLDNANLANRNVNADAYYLGGLYAYGAGHMTKAEVGRRDLGNSRTQNVVRLEQIRILESGWVPKAGLWLGKASGAPREYTVNAGINIPITASVRLEPMLFYAKSGEREREVRALLFGEYTARGGQTIGVGVSTGDKRNTPNAEARDEVFLLAGLPIRRAERQVARLQFLARRESGGGSPATTLLALGVSLNF